MTIVRGISGKWLVVREDGAVLSEHATHAEAWRALDRLAGEPINKREATADWLWRKRPL